MSTARDRQPACGFCDGSGVWPDSDGDVAAADPCPLCEGAGVAPASPVGGGEEPPSTEAVALNRFLALLPRLTQPERQRLYEELHAIYDCRIYRS